MNNLEWIENFENTKLFEVIINILLVAKGSRNATLIEWNNFSKEEKEKYEPLGMKFIQDLNLTTLPYPFSDSRIFVVKNKNISAPKDDDEIVKILELECDTPEYYNKDVNRIAGKILEIQTKQQIYLEVCDSSKIDKNKLNNSLEKKVENFNGAMKSLGLKYRFEIEIKELTPREELLKNYRNKDFLSTHLNDYAELLYNEFHEKTRFNKNPNLMMERFDVFDLVMQLIKNGDLFKLYSSVTRLSKEYNELLRSLYELENIMFRT